jgi:photosystem II stability/assembly factor-like uncharacterized protein
MSAFACKILFSFDNCRSEWIKMESDLNSIPTKDGCYIFLAFLSSDVGWVQGMNYIFHTTNGGKNWERIPLQATVKGNFNKHSISFVDNDHGWIINADSLYATADGGKQWSAIHLPTTEFNRILFHRCTKRSRRCSAMETLLDGA